MAQGYFNGDEDLDRRRALAEALYQRGQEENSNPGRMVSGHYVQTPLQSLAAALKAGLGGYAVGAVNRASDERREKTAKDLALLLGGVQQGPESPQFSPPEQMRPEENAGMSGPAPAMAQPNPAAPNNDIMARLLATGNPALIGQMAPALFERGLNRQDKMEDRDLNRKDKAKTVLTPAEVAQLGFRPGTILEKDAFGGIDVVQSPDTISPEAMRQKLQIAAASRAHMGGGGASRRVQSSKQLSDGTIAVLYTDGTGERLNIDGSPVIGAQYDPQNTFNRAAAQSGGKAAGTMAEDLPRIDATFSEINKSLDAFERPEVKAQAGRSLGVLDSKLPAIPGYNSNFVNRAEQVAGQTFLQAFNALRGGGQITEAEGAKATAAMARLSRAQTEKEFYDALKDAKSTFSGLYSAAKTRAGRGAVVPQLQGNSPSQALPDPLGLRGK